MRINRGLTVLCSGLSDLNQMECYDASHKYFSLNVAKLI